MTERGMGRREVCVEGRLMGREQPWSRQGAARGARETPGTPGCWARQEPVLGSRPQNGGRERGEAGSPL